MSVQTAIEKLGSRIEAHRKKEEVTCRTNCWCWDAEALLIAIEAAQSEQRTECSTGLHSVLRDENQMTFCPECGERL